MTEEKLFARAIELSGEERNAFLGETCASDPAQRSRVEKLLAAHESDSGILKRSPKRSDAFVRILGGQNDVVE